VKHCRTGPLQWIPPGRVSHAFGAHAELDSSSGSFLSSGRFAGRLEKKTTRATAATINAQDLNRLLQEIKNLPGVQRTLTTIVLSTLFERGIQP